MDEKALRKLREKLDKLLAANRNEEAVVVLAELVRAEPTNPRWAHKRGDLFRRLGRTPDAVEAYSLAVDIYAKTGFIARAVAMAKTVLSLDPTRVDVLQRVDPNAAQQLHRQTRPGAVSVRPPVAPQSGHTLQGTGRHPMVVGEDAPAPAARHPMVLDEDAPVAAAAGKRHPMVLEEDAPVAAAAAKRHPMVLDEDAPAAAAAVKRHPMVLDEDAPAPAARHPMVLEEDAPAAAPPIEHEHEHLQVPVPAVAPAAPARGRPAPPPPPSAAKTMTGSGGKPLPPPPPAAAAPKRPITLDQLSLPPPAARPAPARPPTRAATMELDSLPPPVAAPPPPPAAARKPPSPPPAPAPAPRVTSQGEPLWSRNEPSGHTPAPVPVAAPRRAPSGPLKPRWEQPSEEAELFSRALEAAVELSEDPAAAPNETRFSNAPPSPSLALSAAEVSPRRAAAVDSDADALQPSADLLSRLPLFPLFAEVPPDALAEMIQGTELLELGDGDYVMRRGDAADALYGIVEGSVAVNVPGSDFAFTLAEGDVFGESCLLQDEPRHADVRVHGRLTALRIPREILLHVLRHHPPLAELLLELLTRRLLANTLQSSPLFQEFDAEGRSTLSTLFEVRRAAEGTRLAVAGKRMDGLYISLTGTLLVETPGQEPRIAAPGSMFGQHTLISREPAPATITARVNLVVLRLPSATFSQLAMQYPTIVMRLAELSTDAVVSVTL